MKPEPLNSVKVETEISPDQYRRFQKFLNSTCGIVLKDDKQYLVSNRLASLSEKNGFDSIDALIDVVGRYKANPKLVTDVIDCMTTNETFWFRDVVHFEELKTQVLTDLSRQKFASPRIWSAACSSGQEPYSISMTVDQYCNNHAVNGFNNVQIIGTDISDSILAQARSGIYSDLALSRGINKANRKRYFEPYGDNWKLKSQIASKVRFQQFNLLKPFRALGQFDVIFCRNVLIYFADEIKIDILTRMAQALKPNGYLFLSSTEAIPSQLDLFELVPDTNVRYFRLKA